MLIGGTKLDLGLDGAVDDYKRLIDNAAGLGTTWLLDCGTGKEEHFEAYFELMRQAAEHARQVGVYITMKPHGGNATVKLYLLEILKMATNVRGNTGSRSRTTSRKMTSGATRSHQKGFGRGTTTSPSCGHPTRGTG